jgi:hypothetical protein
MDDHEQDVLAKHIEAAPRDLAAAPRKNTAGTRLLRPPIKMTKHFKTPKSVRFCHFYTAKNTRYLELIFCTLLEHINIYI